MDGYKGGLGGEQAPTPDKFKCGGFDVIKKGKIGLGEGSGEA